MKKKELKKRFAACEQSLQRTNENFDQLCKDNKEQTRTIDDLTRLHNSKIKYIDQLKKEIGDCYAEISRLLQELKDERARFQKEWGGVEGVALRKTCAYIQECYEIKEAEVKEYKREVQEKTAQIKNQRNLIEDAQEEIEELKIVIKARDEKIEKLKGQWNGTLNIPDPGPMSEIARLGQIIKDQEQEIERLNSRLQAIDVA